MKLPKICFVVAYSQNQVIGAKNQLPWHLPNDLKHFKELTRNQHILMGRKTLESIGRPLPNREMIVLTRQVDFKVDYARTIHDLSELQPLEKDLFIIGGAEIYQLLLPQADLIYATEIKTKIEGDAFFPPLNREEWQEISRESHSTDERHAFDYDFVCYAKKIR
ncbi:MAG: dihydrofolate reductase [Gammaproteobacteria bacterium]|jgi:dihydrofolate reductase|nr:dihydrofolate reductase [Gammaproteobacteria bacterium]